MLVGADGRPRVLDFGLARSFADPHAADAADAPRPGRDSVLSVDLTVAGAMMGTPSFMSPEHFRGEGIGPASDQLGFAVAAYRALFGTAPFAGDTLGELRTSVCGGAVGTPTVDGDLPPAVVTAVLRALALDPTQRFATMDALLEELERPLRVDPLHDPARGRRARRLAAAVLGLGALASLISSSALAKIALPHQAGPAFGALVLVYAAAAAWRWGGAT